MKRVCYQAAPCAVLTALGVVALVIAGCSGTDNGVNNGAAQGKMVLLMHDAPVDDFKEVWLTVESVSMIGAGADSASAGRIVLADPIRMNFLALDSTAQIIGAANIAAGSYSKIRLQVSNPEFVRDDDSVFSGDAVHLVANGHVDINTQGDVLIIGNEVTVVSLDLDLQNSLQINQTGNGRYTLRPQIFVDNSFTGVEGIIISGAVIKSVDLVNNTITIETSGMESDASLTIKTGVQTEILSIGGLPISLTALPVGAAAEIVGTIDVDTGLVTASWIRITS